MRNSGLNLMYQFCSHFVNGSNQLKILKNPILFFSRSNSVYTAYIPLKQVSGDGSPESANGVTTKRPQTFPPT